MEENKLKKVAILGAGLVTGPLAHHLMDECGFDVLMATRTKSQAEEIIGDRSNGRAVAWTSDQREELESMVQEVDIVVSMIPPNLHVPVAKACLRHRTNMVTTSYISPEMEALDTEAKEKGILLLNEIGEDPGMDHMGAKQMIDKAHAEGEKVLSLVSYGAGLPSFQDNRNPVGYKFSWSPRGVMMAAQTAAAYVEKGKVVRIPARELFDHHWLVDIEGLGTFETYPNRDSVRYLEHFGLDKDASLYRGLLRFTGWCNLMKSLVALNYLDGGTEHDLSGMTFRDFTAGLIGESVATRETLAAFLELSPNSDTVKRLNWLGLLEESPIPFAKGANVDVLVERLLKKLTYGPGEKDMIIVHDEIVVERNGRKERRLSTMCVEGEPHGYSAMSRAVSLPAAIATRLILEGKIDHTGVCMPMHPGIYEPVLERLGELGFRFKHRTTPA